MAAGGARLVTSICSTAAGLGGAGGNTADWDGKANLTRLLSPDFPGSSEGVVTATSNVPLLAVMVGVEPEPPPFAGAEKDGAWPGGKFEGPRSASAPGGSWLGAANAGWMVKAATAQARSNAARP